MDDVKELKDVLDRIEKKLIAASKMYNAMNFAIWLVVVTLFYVLMPLPGNGSAFLRWFVAIYWFSAVVIVLIFQRKTWKMVYRLKKERDEGNIRRFGIFVSTSWIVGAIIGWVLIPQMGISTDSDINFAIGFLSFIAISVFGMWVSMMKYYRMEIEIIPAFLIPAIGIPITVFMNQGVVWFWSGLVVALGYSITALWELYSAFRTITW